MRLLVTSGRGPGECRVAVKQVVDAIIADAKAADVEWNMIAGTEHAQGHGPSSVIVLLDGAAASIVAKAYLGTIQYVWQSTIRPGHKRKNWFVSVSELAEPEKPLALDASHVKFEAFRAGGPGGQHQDSTDSAVRATHRSGLAVVVREGRSQHRNKEIALRRLGQIMQSLTQINEASLREEAQRAHDSLERGNPVKVIRA